MRILACVIGAALTAAACAEMPKEDPPNYYWVTQKGVDEIAACLASSEGLVTDGRSQTVEIILPGQYLEVRPEHAMVMGGGTLYYVGVSRQDVGASLFLHGYGTASDAMRPAIDACV